MCLSLRNHVQKPFRTLSFINSLIVGYETIDGVLSKFQLDKTPYLSMF